MNQTDSAATEAGGGATHRPAGALRANAHQQALVDTLAAAIGCEPWSPSENLHHCAAVRCDIAKHLLRDQHHHYAIETPDAADGGTITHVVALMHHAVVRLIVCMPPYNLDDEGSIAQVTVVIEDHYGEPSEQILSAYDKTIQMTAEASATTHLTWLRGLEPSQLAAGLRAIFDAPTLARLSRLLSPVKPVGA